MKTLTNITATVTDDGKPFTVMQSKTFRRQLRQTADGIYVESTTGGRVLLPIGEIYAAAEKIEPLLLVPK